MAIDSITALKNTFWGMFQIVGDSTGVNVGAESIKDFVDCMSSSEHEQLPSSFVEFRKSQGLDKYS